MGEFGRMMTGIESTSNDAKVDVRSLRSDSVMTNLDPIRATTLEDVDTHVDDV